MAEVFDIISGAVGIAAIFNNCVETFGLIQIGRNFGNDYQTELLTLRMLQSRLSRWGEAIHINDITENDSSPLASATKAQLDLILKTVTHIESLLRESEEMCRKYSPSPNGYTKDDMKEPLHALDRNLASLISRRQQKAQKFRLSPRKLVSWALYSKEHFSKFTSDIKKSLDELEKILLIPEQLQKLKGEEIKLVTDVSIGPDTQVNPIHIFLAVNGGGIKNSIPSNVQIGNLDVEEMARLQNGDVITQSWQGQSIPHLSGSSISVAHLNAKGNARVRNGNVYVDRDPFWD
ncbi:hypothetical protein GYMLUDRAFT_170006 [Collybiopsis luxurians FD-317 M1]|uniref:Prion-inhibition and propagation HeLo domain-containing protein n=1 Tax=Collybiopsis luxurians FD-317 M1 TaxID=944289 RepID=A0A0D0B6L9_9AGAR|nr:hypothetical protein GYMLUDRAFT_170006 [Collybiopsis luxurians FD-317 M1]